MKVLLGLTGSIGMGKSTAAKMFATLGCHVWDADAAVHRAYAPGGSAVEPIKKLLPAAITNDGVSRDVLKSKIAQDSSFLAKLETVIHPLVLQDREKFISDHPAGILVFDIPLLYETGAQDAFDYVACVLTSAAVQKIRVLARPGMTEEHFKMILSKQMPADEKAKKADFVIPTDTLDQARSAIENIVNKIKEGRVHA